MHTHIKKYIYKIPILFLGFTLLFGFSVTGADGKKKASDPFSQVKFTPNISFILDFSLVNRNLERERFQSLEIPGFSHGGGHDHGEGGHGHEAANANQGFNLNYGEMVIAAAVDPYFDLFVTFHLTENEFEIEEAYLTSRKLPLGLQLKMGKFLSAFGRLNSQHAHYWDFAEAPLVYRGFFGDHGFAELGMQLNWIAPTDFYLKIGVESLQGNNESSFGTNGFHVVDADTESEVEIEDTVLPNVWTAYVNTSFDIGDLTILGGVSYAWGKHRMNGLGDEHHPMAYSGNTRLTGFHLTMKYSIDSYRYIRIEGEYIHRTKTGLLYESHHDEGDHEEHEHEDHALAGLLAEEHDEHDEHDEHGEHDEAPEVEISNSEKRQAGFFAQLIFRFHRQWRFGSRLDLINRNEVLISKVDQLLPDSLKRYGLMLDYSPTEFSRIRLQYNINKFAYHDGIRQDYNEILLQFNLAIGAHGAHPF